jgi:hypothetical protein
MRAVNHGGAMNRHKGLPTATIILAAIFIAFTCLSCGGTYSDDSYEALRKAKIPIYLPELEPTTSTQDYKVALNFGIAISDALACIYNEDQSALPRYMGMVYDYGRKLGISQVGLQKLAGITAAMNQGNWEKVLQLSTDFGKQVMKDLKEAGKKTELDLTISAWGMERIYITAKSVDNHFSPESAKVLRDFESGGQEEKPEPLPAGLKDKKEVNAIMAALPKIAKIINQPKDYTYTRTDVKELVSICESLRKTLLSD